MLFTSIAVLTAKTRAEAKAKAEAEAKTKAKEDPADEANIPLIVIDDEKVPD